MQLYHHPYSMNSQKVRLVLEEKGIDYTSFHVNPLTGKNMDAPFFRMNPSAKLPVFQNGSHVIFRTMDIIQYIDKLSVSLNGEEDSSSISREVMKWMEKIEDWHPKLFTFSYVPAKYRMFISKFLHRVIIARMAEAPDLASVYHVKLREAYDSDDKLRDHVIVKQCEEKLMHLLDDAEMQLKETMYLTGSDFTVADCMFIPVLVRITLLGLEKEYINPRSKLVEYYNLVKKRSCYKKVIGKYFSGWRRYKTLFKTLCYLSIRSVFRKY